MYEHTFVKIYLSSFKEPYCNKMRADELLEK